jgi:hypothetical protein
MFNARRFGWIEAVIWRGRKQSEIIRKFFKINTVTGDIMETRGKGKKSYSSDALD